MRLIDHNTGETIENVPDLAAAQALMDGRRKAESARLQQPHFSVYEDAGTLVHRVYAGKPQPLTDSPAEAIQKDLADLKAAYGAVQNKLENFEAQTGTRCQDIENRLAKLEKPGK